MKESLCYINHILGDHFLEIFWITVESTYTRLGSLTCSCNLPPSPAWSSVLNPSVIGHSSVDPLAF